MELWEEDEPAIRRYLLGDATESEAWRIEIQMMVDEAFAEGVEVIEGELIDEYVWGELEGHERVMFVVKYMRTEEGRRRVAFAGALRRYMRSRAGLGSVTRGYADLIIIGTDGHGARDGGEAAGGAMEAESVGDEG